MQILMSLYLLIKEISRVNEKSNPQLYWGDYQSRRLSLKLFTDPKLRCQKKPEKR